MRYNQRLGYLILVLGLAITFQWSAATAGQLDNQAEVERETLTIPIAVYILTSDKDSSKLSSKRTVESMGRHFEDVNRIWSQADIIIEPVAVRKIRTPDHLIKGLSNRIGYGGIADFFRAIYAGEIIIENPHRRGTIKAFYVHSLGGPNGLKPLGVNALFVADKTTVRDTRVTSHEIGHNLGLYHSLHEAGQLLFSGSNGVALTEVEQTVARYYAGKLLQQNARNTRM